MKMALRTFGRTVAAAGVAVAMLATAACGGGGDDDTTAGGLQKVTMIMEWPTADAFWTPFLVARDKGYYEDAGIDLEITPPPTVADTMKFLGTGKADVAFTTTLDVLFARDQSAPVIATGAYGASNNWGLLAKEPFDLADLKGKKVGIYNDAWSKAQLSLMLASVGLKPSDVSLVTAADDTVPLLLEDKVDVITGVTNAEASGIRTAGKIEPFFMPAKDHGVPDAPVWLVAGNTDWLKKNPRLAKAFMAATTQGLKDSLADPAEALAIFKKAYPESDMAFIKDSWDATAKLLAAQEPPFAQSDAQWADLLDVAVSDGLVEKTGTPGSYWTDDYLGD
jgi:putative hydroxymethylpyrimidine transport system substrate-binding protein